MKTRRLLGSLAALAVAASLVPVVALGSANAADVSCTPPTGLAPNDAYRSVQPYRTDITLSWAPVAGATSYQVQAGHDEDFTGNIALDTSTVGTSVAVPVGVLDDSSFFWRVRVTGSACWSDDGATPAASVTKGHDPATDYPHPTPDNGYCATGSIPLSDVAFCWAPLTDMAYYEVAAFDQASGTPVGRCFTEQTYLSPEALVTTAPGAAERLDPKRSRCFGTTDFVEGGSYDWEVRGINQSGVTPDGNIYGTLIGGPPSTPPADAPPTGPLTVTNVQPRFVSSSGGDQVTVTGTGFVAGTTSVKVAGQTIDATAVTVVNGNTLTFTVPTGVTVGTSDLIVNESGSSHTSVATPYDRLTVLDSSQSADDTDDLTGAEVSNFSPVQTFTITTTPLSGTLAAPAAVAITGPTTTGASTKDCAIDPADPSSTKNDCATTPYISWTPNSAANEYRVSIFNNADLSSRVRTYETHSSLLATRDLLLPSQSGYSYEVVVQSCNNTRCTRSYAGPYAFRVRSQPVVLVAPVQATTSTNTNITLSWSDYLTTNGSALEAADYQVQVASDCAFSSIVDSSQVDFTTYTSPSLVYAPGTYYWRVGTVDAAGNTLPWGASPNKDVSSCSAAQRFTIAPAPPAPGTAGSGTGTAAPTGPTAPLSIRYPVAVSGISAATVQLIEGSTGRVVPAVFKGLSDGAVLTPAPKDLVPGETYTLRVTGPVLDSLGRVVSPLDQTPYRAPTLLQVPGLFVKLSGTWQTRKAAGSYGGTAVVTSSKKRPSATLRFRGAGIAVGFCKGPSNGYLSIYVDGKLKKTVSTYAPFTQCGQPGKAKAPTYLVGKLNGAAQHTITVVETGRKGTRHGVSAAIDYFNIA